MIVLVRKELPPGIIEDAGMADQSVRRLLSLPSELRNTIYELLLL